MKGIGCAAILLFFGMAGPAQSQVSPDADRAHSGQNHINAHVILGEALQIKGDLDGAIAEYCMAINAEPENYLAHYDLGIALYAKGDLDGAIIEYRKSIRIAPK